MNERAKKLRKEMAATFGRIEGRLDQAQRHVNESPPETVFAGTRLLAARLGLKSLFDQFQELGELEKCNCQNSES